MIAALRGKYLEAVFYMGENQRYPDWFCEELYDATFTDESRYTFWVDRRSRRADYYEKTLVEDYSVFLRKESGEIFVTNYDCLDELYTTFRTDAFSNSALVAFNEDVINYAEFHGGVSCGYPDDWFYEHFTESLHNPVEGETIFVADDGGDITVTEHCVIMQNNYGEIKVLDWATFTKFYDPDPGI